MNIFFFKFSAYTRTLSLQISSKCHRNVTMLTLTNQLLTITTYHIEAHETKNHHNYIKQLKSLRHFSFQKKKKFFILTKKSYLTIKHTIGSKNILGKIGLHVAKYNV